jgi:geranylgeranyl diphosphate synthase type II
MTNLKSIAELQELLQNSLVKLSLESKPTELYQPIRYIIDLGGKRLRPALVLMAADMFGGDVKRALPQAMGIELFHNFTLMHDDIMDQAPLRRGKTTVHEKWSTNIAILSGDALFVKAYQSLVQADPKLLPHLMSLFNATALEVCEGQQYDMNFEEMDSVSMQEYLKMIEYKTAVLLGCALKSGAIVAEASKEDQKQVYDFGIHIGLAFQLMDDILDVYADEANFGKQIAGDILCNKKTCLYIKAYEKASSLEKEVLDHYFAHQDFNPKEKINKVIEVYNSLNVRQDCMHMMDEHYAMALKCMENLSVDDARKQVLKEFVELLMVRVN